MTSANKKAAQAASAGTASKKQSDKPHFTRNADPLLGWLALGKTARLRPQKKSWSRKHRAFIHPVLLAQIGFALVLAAVLIVGGRI